MVGPRNRQLHRLHLPCLVLASLLPAAACHLSAQQDQGGVTGIIKDSAGAVVVNATVTLTEVDQGFTLTHKTNSHGIFQFTPIKVGNYSVTVAAPGFASETELVTVDVQSNVNVPFTLRPGSASETVTITSDAPQLQTQDASLGQVFDSKTIAEIPVTQGNWVFMAQLEAGVAPSANSRGLGSGDFNANGQRAEQNNFILDGVDNNVNTVGFINGGSFVNLPPPEALEQFKILTNSFSAEFGHSSGATLIANIKSGTNSVHGSLSEQFRNDILDANEWHSLSKAEYRQNLFTGTIGFPLIKDKLFFFGDAQANRIIFGQNTVTTVPTPLMRTGNFSELLNTTLSPQYTGPVMLYVPNSGGKTLLTCNGMQNVFCPSQIDPVAQTLINLYPLPNTGPVGLTYQNYNVNLPSTANTVQFDTRVDFDLSQKDQMFGRFSYSNLKSRRTPPFGYILGGGGDGNDGSDHSFGENFAGSETHIFTPNLVNEFRFGYNYLRSGYVTPDSQQNVAAQEGLGGIPFSPGNGGLPRISITGSNSFGVPSNSPTSENENVYQILDNVTISHGKHSVRAGVSFQAIRSYTYAPLYNIGYLTFNGSYTSNLSKKNTGFGMADFLANQPTTAEISNQAGNSDSRWYRAAYVQDDWRLASKLTVNLGVRYDYYQPYKAVGGYQANFVALTTGISTGTGQYLIPSVQRNLALATSFTNALTANNISLQYIDNQALATASTKDFGPRVGMSYAFSDTGVIRGGFGIFFGGLESLGGDGNLGYNYPFQFNNTYTAPTCSKVSCPSVSQTFGINLDNGFSAPLANGGILNNVATPSLIGNDTKEKITYNEGYNLSVQQIVSKDTSFTISYVGNVSRHLQVFLNPNSITGLVNPSVSAQPFVPFPSFGGVVFTSYSGAGSYNALQAKLQKHLGRGFQVISSYTWAHSIDDAQTALDGQIYRDTNIIPVSHEYTNSQWDLRNRVTFNGYYQLPAGKGFSHFNKPGLTRTLLGNWSTDLQFQAQTGRPITIGTYNTAPKGTNSNAILVGDPYAPGGTPDPNVGGACPAKVRTVTNWFNPCAFRDPALASAIPSIVGTTATPGVNFLQGYQNAVNYLGGPARQIYGPGYNKVDISLFKDFPIFETARFQFRADEFNVFNTPPYGNPSTSSDGPTGGQITSVRTLQTFTPTSRFAQFTAKIIW